MTKKESNKVEGALSRIYYVVDGFEKGNYHYMLFTAGACLGGVTKKTSIKDIRQDIVKRLKELGITYKELQQIHAMDVFYALCKLYKIVK